DFRAVMDAASDGLTYRADLIQAALDEGVRAYGDKFDRAGYELDLRVASIQSIKRMKDDWTRAADAIFKGGRKTQDEGNPPPDTSATNFTPAGAFMG
ncbi:MAG: hypothetical protein JOZ52_08405, partial [Acidobacteria bacterium]|nr:hypothetical protein [Acidobacteriota bacterium]